MRLHRSEPLRQYMSPVIKLSAIQLCVPMSIIDRYFLGVPFEDFSGGTHLLGIWIPSTLALMECPIIGFRRISVFITEPFQTEIRW